MKISLLILASAAALSAQDFTDLHIEKVSGGYQFLEGPVWSKEGGYLLFSDVPASKVLKIDSEGIKTFRAPSGKTNGNTIDAQGRVLSCESEGRRVVRQDKKGNWEVLADKWEGKRLNAPNDIVVRKDGHIYFTDPAFGNQADKRELDFYGVYHIPPKGSMELVAKPTGRPNGIAFSPKGNILYVANTDDRNIRAYDLDKNGKATNERVFISNIDGPPDGIRVDEKGNLWITCRGIAVYTAEGKLLHMIEMAEPPANCAFGDGDMETLYITARTSLYRVRVGVKGSVQH